MVTYDKLIGADGQPHFGRFDQPVRQINVDDFYYATPMDRKAGRLARHFDYKQFQFVGLTSERYILGCAIVSLKYVSNAFVYLFDRHHQSVREISLLQPFGFGCSMSNRPDEGCHKFRKAGSRFNFSAQSRQRQVDIVSKSDVNIQLNLTEPTDFSPIAVCTRTGFNGWTYTQKANALPVTGRIQWQELEIDIDQTFFGSYDWSCGYMRRQTAWNWASLSGTLEDGSRIGANLANGVNETGFTENGFWINDKPHPLGPVNFEFDRRNRNQPWRITSSDRQLELVFTPEGERREKLDFLLLASNFTQLTGTFNGHLVTRDGATIQLQAIPGFCEDHYAKW